jgi:type IV pilus assembly protein PilM
LGDALDRTRSVNDDRLVGGELQPQRPRRPLGSKSMWNRKQSNIQPIGLDLGHDSVKLLQLEVRDEAPGSKKGRSLSVVAAAKQAIPEEARKNPSKRVEIAATVIERMLAQQPFVGRNVVATLPRELVHVKNLRLPPLPANELATAVRCEAKGVFPFDIEDAHIEYLPAGEVRQGKETRQEVIALAVKNHDIETYLQQLDRCGVVVSALEAEITGLFRSFERFIRRRDDESDVQMLIDIGARRTQVIISKGRDISFYKPVEIGGLHLLDAISRKLSITVDEARALRHRLLDRDQISEGVNTSKRDPVKQAVFDSTRSVAEELAQELSMCLRYFTVTFRGYRPARVRLVGGEAVDPQLQAIIQSSLDIPVEAGRPLFSVDTSRMRSADRRGTMSHWTLAMGLSLRFVDGYFASRDGKRRTVIQAPPEAVSAALESEVVHA